MELPSRQCPRLAHRWARSSSRGRSHKGTRPESPRSPEGRHWTYLGHTGIGCPKTHVDGISVWELGLSRVRQCLTPMESSHSLRRGSAIQNVSVDTNGSSFRGLFQHLARALFQGCFLALLLPCQCPVGSEAVQRTPMFLSHSRPFVLFTV